MNNAEIQIYREKYSTPNSGRPVKKSTLEIAQRDRQKQVINLIHTVWRGIHDKFQIFLSQTTETSSSIAAIQQLAALSNASPIDYELLFELWVSTINTRRKDIRNKTTREIMSEYPGYSIPLLVSDLAPVYLFKCLKIFKIFEEIKMTCDFDIRSTIRDQIPILLEKFSSVPSFNNGKWLYLYVIWTSSKTLDSTPIQTLKVLCRYFEETSSHVVNNSVNFCLLCTRKMTFTIGKLEMHKIFDETNRIRHHRTLA